MVGPLDRPTETHEQILAAAYRALLTHGYANLTIGAISEELGKSSSLVYHHYEDKDDLLVSLLEFLLGHFERNTVSEGFPADPAERIGLFVDAAFDPEDGGGPAPPPENDGPESDSERDGPGPGGPSTTDDGDPPAAGSPEGFMRVMVELRAQAAHDPNYRAYFDRSDPVFREYLANAIRDGLEDGTFTADDVDPEEVAMTLLTVSWGVSFRWATMTDHDWMTPTKASIEYLLDETLYDADDAATGYFSTRHRT